MPLSSADLTESPRCEMISPDDHAATAVQDEPGKNYQVQECNDPVSPSHVRDHDFVSIRNSRSDALNRRS